MKKILFCIATAQGKNKSEWNSVNNKKRNLVKWPTVKKEESQQDLLSLWHFFFARLFFCFISKWRHSSTILQSQKWRQKGTFFTTNVVVVVFLNEASTRQAEGHRRVQRLLIPPFFFSPSVAQLFVLGNAATTTQRPMKRETLISLAEKCLPVVRDRGWDNDTMSLSSIPPQVQSLYVSQCLAQLKIETFFLFFWFPKFEIVMRPPPVAVSFRSVCRACHLFM